jgi:hypothetical protein
MHTCLGEGGSINVRRFQAAFVFFSKKTLKNPPLGKPAIYVSVAAGRDFRLCMAEKRMEKSDRFLFPKSPIFIAFSHSFIQICEY